MTSRAAGRASHLQLNRKKGDIMRNKSIRYLSSLVLIGALAAPLALQAQDRDDRQGRNNRNNNQRVYDRQHKDYHQWDGNENRTYQQWYAQNNNGRPSR